MKIYVSPLLKAILSSWERSHIIKNGWTSKGECVIGIILLFSHTITNGVLCTGAW